MEPQDQLTSDDIKWLEYFIYPAWEDSLSVDARWYMKRLISNGLVEYTNSVYFQSTVLSGKGKLYTKNETSKVYSLTEDGYKVLQAYRNLKGDGD